MYVKNVTINIADIDPELSGELKFRQIKASESMLMQEKRQEIEDINVKREKEGLKPITINSTVVAVMEKIMYDCYLEGKDGETVITKKEFAQAFSTPASVLHIYTKLDEASSVGLEKEVAESKQILEPAE